MTKFAKISTTRFGAFAAVSAALFSTLLLTACGGDPLAAALPFAPSALPSSTLALDAADGIDASGALGKRNDKGKDDKGKNDKGKGKDDDDDDVDSGVPVTTTMVDIEGVVSDATGDCPARTFVVGLQSVVTDAATRFEGGFCAQLARLAAVEVRAARQADGTLLAKDVEFDDADVDDDDAGRWEGTVSGLGIPATCPAITFIVATRTVVTDLATVFQGGMCAQVLNDVNVRVRGTLQTNGTVLASRVEIRTEDDEDGDDDEDEDDSEDDDGDGTPHHGAGPHDGTVSSFRGGCPRVTFNLKGLTIVADAETTYVGGTCAMLRPSVKVVVTGALAPLARRTFNAETITITRRR